MRGRMLRIVALGILIVATMSGKSSARAIKAATRGDDPQRAAGKPCDYACLTDFIDRYLAALVAHDPSRLPVAAHAKFTENTMQMKLGDALWGTISGTGSYKVYFADPHAGEAGCEVTIRENGTPAILVVRLKIVDRKITEVETIVRRGADPAEALEKFGHPNPVWLEPVPASDRTSRQDMLKDANLYFEGIVHLDGDIPPFDDKCNRILDGIQDTNNPSYNEGWANGTYNPAALGCRDNMNTKIWAYIKAVDPRRFMIVDEKMGIVFGFFMFNHPGTVLEADVPGIGKIPMPPSAKRPFNVEVAEFFKIRSGKILQVEGVQLALPYKTPTGWDH
ncbi:MAG TPA: hypothetical protein VNV41_09905 [Candidatus Acidoferrales bacterium]|jgi:hypothetical protein|nr:hypothetical protein [Candidatus Acidoferrales bacterium]